MATNPELADLIEAGLIIETPDQLREEKREAQVRQVRVAVGGHEQAAVRRIVLYTATCFFIGGGWVFPPVLIFALITLFLLGLSDQLA